MVVPNDSKDRGGRLGSRDVTPQPDASVPVSLRMGAGTRVREALNRAEQTELGSQIGASRGRA